MKNTLLTVLSLLALSAPAAADTALTPVMGIAAGAPMMVVGKDLGEIRAFLRSDIFEWAYQLTSKMQNVTHISVLTEGRDGHEHQILEVDLLRQDGTTERRVFDRSL